MSGRPPLSCTCPDCAPATSPIEHLALWIALIGFVAIPGRAIVHLALGVLS